MFCEECISGKKTNVECVSGSDRVVDDAALSAISPEANLLLGGESGRNLRRIFIRFPPKLRSQVDAAAELNGHHAADHAERTFISEFPSE